MNKPGKRVSLAVWSLVLALFTLVAFHVPFFRHLFANVEAGTNGVVIAVTAALLLLVLFGETVRLWLKYLLKR